MDKTGAAVIAHLQLTRQDQSQIQERLSGDSGQFLYTDVLPGPFQLTITAEVSKPRKSLESYTQEKLTLCRRPDWWLPVL